MPRHTESTFDQFPIGVVGVDRRGVILSWNRRAGNILGRENSEVINAAFAGLFPDYERPSLMAFVERSCRTEGDPACEVFARQYAGGREQFVQIVGSRWESADQALLIVQDVTDQVTVERDHRRAVVALGESEERFRKIFENSPIGITLVGPDARFQRVNSAFCHMTGYREQELLQLTFADITHPEDVEKDSAQSRKLFAGEIPSYRMEKRYITRSGELLWIHMHASVMRDDLGKPLYRLTLVENITDRKQAQLELQEAHETLRAVIETSPLPVIAVDMHGIVKLWNAAAQRVFGWSQQEVLDRPLPIVPREEAATLLQSLQDHRRGAVSTGAEYRRLRKDGSLIDVQVWTAPLRDAAGEVAGVMGLFVDVTERKQLAEQLRQTQKLEGLGVLAGGVAHDFNNLLTGILGNASLALDMLRRDDPACGMLEDVIRASERAADLTRQLLAYSGKGRFVVQPVQLSSLVREIIKLIHAAIPKKVELVLDLADDLPFTQADPSQVQQIIMNLVINGAEAIGEETGVVRVRTGCEYVEPQQTRTTLAAADFSAGDYVVLEVSDTGIGMDEATKSQIFDPFFTTKFMGRGLGLAAVLGIVRGHQGAIHVETAPLKGTTFKVFFPAAGRQGRARQRSRHAQELLGQGVVLVVDDEDVVRRTAKLALEHCGYTVLLANQGREALEVFQKHRDRVRLVILDMMMPIMNGEEALERLLEIRPDVNVIASSGYSEVEALRRFARPGLRGFIQKPYTHRQIAAKVKQVLCDAASSS